MASVKVGVLLGKLAAKAGVDTTTEAWKPILALDTEITDTEATAFEEKLLTIEAAKSNKDLGIHFKSQVLAGADAKIEALIAEYGLTVDDDFKNDRNTYEKITKVAKLLNDHASKKAGAKTGEGKEEWITKEKELRAELKGLQDKTVSDKENYEALRESDLTNFEIKTILSGKKFSLPEDMDSSLKISTALGAVNNNLEKEGFAFKRNEAGNLIVVRKEDGTPAFTKTNEAIVPNTFIDGALAQQKLLKINDDVKKDANGKVILTENQGVKNTSVLSEIDTQLNDPAFKM